MKKGTQVSEKIPAANRQYKDTVFRMLFSEKENLLSLYNAVTGNAYQNADDLKIVTLENAIYMGMKNDLAFMLETNIYLYEHQSTLNPNIPLRDLIYIGIEYLWGAGVEDGLSQQCIHSITIFSFFFSHFLFPLPFILLLYSQF